jgi:hypothetical protein
MHFEMRIMAQPFNLNQHASCADSESFFGATIRASRPSCLDNGAYFLS